MKGFITIETDDEVHWFVNGVAVFNHPGIEWDEYHYVGNPDMADAIHHATREGADLSVLLEIIGGRY
jgi:hypothetical protein